MSKVRSIHPAGSSSDGAESACAASQGVNGGEAAELRRLLAEAQEARARAEQANAAKNKLLVKVAHDLRTPLSSMMLNAQRLREHDPVDRADLTRISESLQRAVQQQTRLIDRMVDASLSDLAELPPRAASERNGSSTRSAAEARGGSQIRSLDRPGNAKQYSTLKDLRILYIDDDFRTREAVLEVLELTGARVALAASPADGMLALDVFKPHVILCDLDMPGEDGFDFVRKLRAREAGQVPAIPVLAFTALASEEVKRDALAAGFQLHLAKPIDIDRLRDAVVRLTELIEITPNDISANGRVK